MTSNQAPRTGVGTAENRGSIPLRLQNAAPQDGLRERLWRALGLPPDRDRLAIIVTADPRWA
jgi:hypothetical protein